MNELLIQLSKKTDGTNVLRCVRLDGTSTWQRRRGDFFPLHDLTHYAVETTLGLCFGFYGLLARGWNITDFGSPWPRGPIPEEASADASLAEGTTGMLDAERHMGAVLRGAEFNAGLAAVFKQGRATLHRPLTDDELERIRERTAVLTSQWRVLEPGETMELCFSVAMESTAQPHASPEEHASGGGGKRGS